MAHETLAGFLSAYDPDGTRVIADITTERDDDGNSPFVIVRHGEFTAVLALMPFTASAGDPGSHLCIDIHPFVNGLDAAAGVFGMTEGSRVRFPEVTGLHSHGWPAARLVSVLIGRQEDAGDPDAQRVFSAALAAALKRVAENGFGECVDDDAIIELAAVAYLGAIGGRIPE